MRISIPYGTHEKYYVHYLAEFYFIKYNFYFIKYNFDERIDIFFEIMSAMYPLDVLNIE